MFIKLGITMNFDFKSNFNNKFSVLRKFNSLKNKNIEFAGINKSIKMFNLL